MAFRRGARFVDRVHALDKAVDGWFDRIRSPRLDPLFYGLSSAADHSLLWHLVGAARAAQAGEPSIVARTSVILGVESALTNGPVKAMFRRLRPEAEPHDPGAPLPFGMRRPITSSFPSGHAAAAFTAATVLADGPDAALWFALAGLVSASRVYVRLHHASDVLAGAALGLAFGTVARRLLPLGGAAGTRR
jgi:undecaprenyl-diphosphatase